MIRDILAPTFAGIVVSILFGLFSLPVIAIGLGAVVVILLSKYGAKTPQYGISGTGFLLGLGIVVSSAQIFPASFSTPLQLTLFVVGILSTAFIAVKFAVKSVLRAIEHHYSDSDIVGELWDIGATVWSFAYLIWNAIQFSERLVRTVLVTLVGPTTITVSVLEDLLDLGLSQWILDVLGIAFIVCVLLAFYTLSTWSRTVRVSKKIAGGRHKKAAKPRS